MSVVLGHWLSVPFATVPRNSVSSFDGISLVLINHGLMLVVCALNHLNHWLYLAKLEDMHKSLFSVEHVEGCLNAFLPLKFVGRFCLTSLHGSLTLYLLVS